jgi:hypothetical protein
MVLRYIVVRGYLPIRPVERPEQSHLRRTAEWPRSAVTVRLPAPPPTSLPPGGPCRAGRGPAGPARGRDLRKALSDARSPCGAGSAGPGPPRDARVASPAEPAVTARGRARGAAGLRGFAGDDSGGPGAAGSAAACSSLRPLRIAQCVGGASCGGHRAPLLPPARRKGCLGGGGRCRGKVGASLGLGRRPAASARGDGACV